MSSDQSDILELLLRSGVSPRILLRFAGAQYVQEVIKTVELELAKVGKALKGKAGTPLNSGYRPELDVSTLLDDEGANYYMNLTGICVGQWNLVESIFMWI